ncbi:MAG: PHP domain-containing protein [Armatimonadota bacterium]
MANPFEAPGHWYKAGLHTHTTNSDGLLSPEEVCQVYRADGYAFLAITDHNCVTDATDMGGDGLVVSRGVELDGGKTELGDTYHVVGIDVPADFELPAREEAQTVIDSINEAEGVCFIAHPYWSSMTVADLMRVERYVGVEVYNYSCRGIGKHASPMVWDGLLVRGRQVTGLAVDDAHFRHPDACGGWVNVKAEECSLEAVTAALRQGSFYSSSGPTITDFRIEDGRARAECSPAQVIYFVCARTRGGYCRGENGELLTGGSFELAGNEGYVRVQVVDERGREAWANPLPVPAPE